MLVLTRKKDQRVVLPGLNVSIKVLNCKETGVKLGFEAPPEIRILRDELSAGLSADDPCLKTAIDEWLSTEPDHRRHDLRNQFNNVLMTLQLLHDDIESGDLKDVNEVYDRLRQRIQGIGTTNDDKDAFVLVVEDQPNERELLAEIMRINGYRVATASDGNEALAYIDQYGVPAFILVDMQMPDCDGVEFIERIHESVNLDGVRIYIVSGSSEDECELSPEYFDGWHQKPVASRELLSSMTLSDRPAN